MQRFMTLLLSVWREACQHTEISEFADRIMPELGRHLPIDLLLVRSVDIRRSCVETLGAGAHKTPPPADTRTACTTEQLEQLLAWCRRDEILRIPDDAPEDACTPYLPTGLLGPALVGPLCSDNGPTGLLILRATPDREWSPLDCDLAKELLAPFTVALDNDRHLREMAAQQQAAQADRHALLTRLGRQEISDAIVGVESGLKPVMERVELVAKSDVPVLLLGETGSGKEVIARAIHTRSERASGPVLRVNCGAIPPELVDSELFGHERGSFTGAVNMRKGWFERADRGTLFLDEIGELPIAAQVRLLRILQDGTFERVGGQHQLKVDVRIVAATNRDLRRMVQEKRFRDDLWYRLAVFPIQLPSLRDRPEDMPALATHFAARAARRFGLPVLAPTAQDIDLLLSYEWPGNIRELASVIDRAALLGEGKCLETAKALGAGSHFPTGVTTEATATATPAASPDAFKTLDEVAAEHIRAVLHATRGQVEGPKGAARILGLNPHTLRGRMRKLGIKWQAFREEETA